MKLKREARLLKQKAVASLRRATTAFNDFDDVGRDSTVLLHLQHAFEMLLKAALVQANVSVFDKRDGRAVGFERCVNLGREHLGLSESQAGVIRAIDALRDDEQHWLTSCSEGLLYLHVRAGITLFDDLLQRRFNDRLTHHWPTRVLPVSAEPPRDIQLLIDDEFTQIKRLLESGRRQRPEARARIRALPRWRLMSLKAPSCRSTTSIESNMPSGTTTSDGGLSVAVQSCNGGHWRGDQRRGPLQQIRRYARSLGWEDEAGAVRELDLQRKFHWSKPDLAAKLGLTQPRCLALRRYLGIETDDSCRHEFRLGNSVHTQYPDNAYRRMRQALDDGVDMDEVWRTGRPGATAGVDASGIMTGLRHLQPIWPAYRRPSGMSTS